ncbi:MAG: hypothetical protein M0P49_04700, partial [Bacilli bacterium]|nr:hypothetical protein [Bacilli bacterium]
MKIIIIILFSIISINAYTQDSIKLEIIGDTRTFTEIFDSKYRNINYDTLSNKLLYSRVFSFADLENRNGHSNDTLNKKDFIQAYSELSRASNPDLKAFSMNVENLNDNIFFNSNDSLVQIGIIYSDFTIIDTNSFNDGRLNIIDSFVFVNDTNTRNIFINKNTFIASALTSVIYDNLSITYNINNLFVFKNSLRNIDKILIDYDNGNGYYSYNVDGVVSILEDINYQTYGDKYLTITIITDNDTLTTKSKITLKQKSTTDEVYDDFHIFADTQFGDVVGQGNMRIYYSNSDKKLSKPLLIVDGFDPTDKRRFDHDFTEDEDDEDKGGIWGTLSYNNGVNDVHLGVQLINKGYDIVILNFPIYIGRDINGQFVRVVDGGADAIQRNATVCEAAIRLINEKLLENNSKEQLVVIGPSMGGQITRYALKTMENNIENYDYRGHNTRLWVSFDSPHQGAYVPLSIIHFLDFYGNKCEEQEAKGQYNVQIRSVAARQMLTGQIETNISLFSSYYNEIDQLGFPDKLRKIAITNGSMNGSLTGYADCNTVQGFFGTKLISSLNMTQNGGVENRIFYGYSPDYKLFHPYIFNATTASGQCSYDADPGGTLSSFKDIWEALDKRSG